MQKLEPRVIHSNPAVSFQSKCFISVAVDGVTGAEVMAWPLGVEVRKARSCRVEEGG